MRILNLLDSEQGDIEAPLMKMAASDNRNEAFYGQKLLEFVRYLQAQGPEPCAFGHILVHELTLRPRNNPNRLSVTIKMDWYDYAPLKDGLPVTHFRLQTVKKNAHLSDEARAFTMEEAERFIYQAFGWS